MQSRSRKAIDALRSHRRNAGQRHAFTLNVTPIEYSILNEWSKLTGCDFEYLCRLALAALGEELELPSLEDEFVPPTEVSPAPEPVDANPDQEILLTTEQAAESLGCHVSTVCRLRRDNKLKAVVYGPRTFRFQAKEVEKCRRRYNPGRS